MTREKNEFNIGTVLYIWKADYNYTNKYPTVGLFLYQGSYKNDASCNPYYTQIIKCADPVTGEVKYFGNREYKWCEASKYIKDIEDLLIVIRNVANEKIPN